MPKGTAGIPSLELVVLNKLIDKMGPPPNLVFSNLFTAVPYDSDTIKWEIEYSTGGLTPFVAPGSPAPSVGLDGIGEQSAKAAYWKEKMYFDEEFLNNLREPGSWATLQRAERQLSKGLRKLTYRSQRRREWMACKMVVDGSLTYQVKGGNKFTVSYGIPTSHLVTLGNARKWGSGTSRNPVEDIFDAKIVLTEDAGVNPERAMLNSTTLKLLMFDASIQTLLQKSTFGEGDLFQNPGPVLASLLGLPALMIYDELYEVTGWLTAAVTANSTVDVYVDDASDFEVGGTLRFEDLSEYDTYEDETITAVDQANNKITVANAPTISLKAGEDRVTMRRKFIPDNKFCMFATSANGVPVAEFMEAPYGIPRRHGFYGDTNPEWDPEGMWLRVQDKGLPVLYYPEVIYTLTVA